MVMTHALTQSSLREVERQDAVGITPQTLTADLVTTVSY